MTSSSTHIIVPPRTKVNSPSCKDVDFQRFPFLGPSRYHYVCAQHETILIDISVTIFETTSRSTYQQLPHFLPSILLSQPSSLFHRLPLRFMRLVVAADPAR
jgi:hypothetical protein